MRTAVAVINLNDVMHPKSRTSVQAAAQRWGSDYIEITEPLSDAHVYWQKMLVPQRLSGYDRVLQLDADILIRSDAPAPFELTEYLGVVSARQMKSLLWTGGRMASARYWGKRLGLKTPRDARCLNAGFFLYAPSKVESLFQEVYEIGGKVGWRPKHLPEQSVLSVLIANRKLPVDWLPHTWNRICPNKGPFPVGAMQDYVYHLAGWGPTERMREVWWNFPKGRPRAGAPGRTHEILKRLPEGACRGVEVGVLRGLNASRLLDRHDGLHLILADRWTSDLEYEKSEDWNAEWTNSDWEIIFHQLMKVIGRFHGRYQLLQGQSADVANAVPDASQDFVFVDADHSYEGCRSDIESWAPKIRPGGWVGGHDYGVSWGGKWGVKQAVDEWAAGRTIERGVDYTWFVRM